MNAKHWRDAKRETRLYGKVDYIVTDSPLLLSAYYAWKHAEENLAAAVEHLVLTVIDQVQDAGHEYLEMFLTRTKPYYLKGRYETEEQAVQIDEDMHGYLQCLGVPLQPLNTDLADLDKFVNRLVKNRLN